MMFLLSAFCLLAPVRTEERIANVTRPTSPVLADTLTDTPSVSVVRRLFSDNPGLLQFTGLIICMNEFTSLFQHSWVMLSEDGGYLDFTYFFPHIHDLSLRDVYNQPFFYINLTCYFVLWTANVIFYSFHTFEGYGVYTSLSFNPIVLWGSQVCLFLKIVADIVTPILKYALFNDSIRTKQRCYVDFFQYSIHLVVVIIGSASGLFAYTAPLTTPQWAARSQGWRVKEIWTTPLR